MNLIRCYYKSSWNIQNWIIKLRELVWISNWHFSLVSPFVFFKYNSFCLSLYLILYNLYIYLRLFLFQCTLSFYLSHSQTLSLCLSMCTLSVYLTHYLSAFVCSILGQACGCSFWLFFIIFASKSCKSIQKHGKLRFWPAFKVHSTQMLVKIYNICLSFYSVSFYSLYIFLFFLLWTTPMTHIEISISVTVNIFVHKCHKNYWLDHWQAMDKKGTWGQSYITSKSNMFSNYYEIIRVNLLVFLF